MIFQYWMIKIQCTENSNDIYYHPVHTVESWLRRIGLKSQVVQEMRGKINVGLGWGKWFLVLRIGKLWVSSE